MQRVLTEAPLKAVDYMVLRSCPGGHAANRMVDQTGDRRCGGWRYGNERATQTRDVLLRCLDQLADLHDGFARQLSEALDIVSINGHGPLQLLTKYFAVGEL